MLALTLTERELEVVLKRLDPDDLEDANLIGVLQVKQAEMLKRKAGAFKAIADEEDFRDNKVYAIKLDAFGCVYGDYCLGKTEEEAMAGAEETFAQTSYGDWNSKAEEVPQ